MAEQRNPLREWRGKRLQSEAAVLINCDLATYIALEMAPSKIRITSANVLLVQAVTKIPLATLIDYFEQKEVSNVNG
jgi:hypothetical protein